MFQRPRPRGGAFDLPAHGPAEPALARLSGRVPYKTLMAFPLPLSLPTAAEAAAEREREYDRDHPERETLALAAAGAAEVLGARHSATRAFARAAQTMDRVDLWRAKLASKTLRADQRQAIAEVVL